VYRGTMVPEVISLDFVEFIPHLISPFLGLLVVVAQVAVESKV